MRSLLAQLLAVGPELASFILTSPLLFATPAHALTPTAAPASNLDLSNLGRVALAGDFDSISLYQYDGQTENALNTNGSQSLLTRFPNGAFESLGLSDAYIQSMCTFQRDGNVQGVVLGGNFTSVAGVMAQSVALWDPNSGNVSPLPGINGKVSTVYCDNDSGTVYVGGQFTAGNSTNAMAWTTQWDDLPFAGFNGPVYSIEKNAAGNIVFAGSFDGIGLSNGNSSGSGPITTDLQVVNLAGGDIGATGTTTLTGFDDPSNIICQTGEDGPGNTWLLSNNTGGWWEGQFSFGFIPTKLRLYNTNYQGRGTKTFYFENLNNGGVLNLNYIGVDGKNQSCSSTCPLPQGNTTAQDFYMVPPVGMDAFRIFITEWYGDGGGLAGIELFQNQLYSFAINDFNEPKCDDVSSGSSSTVTPATGLWNRIPNNGQTSSDYLSAYLTTTQQVDENPSVVFTPSITQSGNYSILVYTPGCLQDGTCATRGTVNMTGTMSAQNTVSTTITQTNYYDKFDQIYYGYVDVDTGSFSPSVTLAPIANPALPQTIVAQRIRFDIVTSTGGLNGLFEYDPSKATVGMNFQDSVIDKAGADLDDGATVNAVISYNNDIYAAGSFSGDGIQNIMQIGSSASSPPGKGLNADVNVLYLDGSTLYLGGNFTNTVDNSNEGLNNVGAFDLDSQQWSTLGAGVDGTVYELVPLTLNVTAGGQQDCITVNGDFTSVNAYNGNDAFDAEGFAVWVPSKNNWLQNIPDADASVSGKLLAYADVPGLMWPLYAGQINSQANDISGAAELLGSGNPQLLSLGISIQPASSTSSMSKRALNGQNFTGVYTGYFYDGDNQNVTVLGGHFSADGTSGSTVQNLVFVDNTDSTQKVTGATELDSDSTIISIDMYNNFAYAGGSLSGTTNGNDIEGLIVYDLDKLAIASPHPPALGGDNVVVYAVAVQPDSSNVYVGGSFDEAGSLPCATLCYYDASAQQWNTPGLGLSGTITAMFWSSKTQLILAGDLTVGNNKTTMATYDSSQKKQTFASYDQASSLPGPITALTPASSSYNEFWAAGTSNSDNSAYLSHYVDGSWNSISGLGAGTDIRGLQVLSLTSDHASSNDVPSDEILMIVGNINVPSFGNASAVLYNGTTFEPFVLTNKDDGSQGTISQLFVSNPSALMQMGGNGLAVGFVVLIGLAIALGLIFLIVVAGLFIERARRRREGYVPMSTDRSGNLDRIPPETLLGGLQGEKGSPPKV